MSKKSTELVDSLQLGKCYLLKDATSEMWVGRLLRIDGPHTAILTDASWVADTGRLHEFMRDGRSAQMEIEVVGTICVHWVTWRPWYHPLFKESV